MKKNFIIIVLLIITILMGGTSYYIYKNQNKIFKKCSVENETKSMKENNKKVNFNINNKTLLQALYGDYYAVFVSKEGEAFLTVQNFENNPSFSNENIESLKNLQDQYTSNTISGYCNSEGEAREIACADGDNVKSIKLDTSNVISAYDSLNGQDPYSQKIVFLKSDGTIDALNIGSIMWGGEKPIIQKNVGDLKNIVTISQSASTGTPSGYLYSIALESDGTQHNLFELFNK